MRFILYVLLNFAVCFGANAGPGALPLQGGATAVLGFREWKAEKIQGAFQSVMALRVKAQKAHSDGQRALYDQLLKDMSQLNWNLEVARDLSVNDYFVLYLSQVSHKDRYQLAASKLQPTEMAELMRAYADSLEVQAPASSPEVPAKGLQKAGLQLPTQALEAK